MPIGDKAFKLLGGETKDGLNFAAFLGLVTRRARSDTEELLVKTHGVAPTLHRALLGKGG